MSSEARIREILSNPYLRLNTLYKIKDAYGNKIPFRLNWAQKDLYENMHYYNVILKARQLGFCLDPQTKVLTADLRWVPIEKLQIGQQIIGVDEHPPEPRKMRKMRTASVQGVIEVFREAYEIKFNNGDTLICTAQHPWLGQKAATDLKWMNIDGSNGRSKLRVGDRVRMITKMWEDGSYEDGWFGGVIDGEGSISLPAATGAEVNVAQREGHVWDRIKNYLCENGYNYRVETDKRESGVKSKLGKCTVHKACISRIDELFRLIGKTRPSRMIGKNFWEGKGLPGHGVENNLWGVVESIKPLGKRRLIDLQTSTGTYIAEGYVSHNTTFAMIYFLDQCLFNPNHSAGVIAHQREAAEDLFRNKIRFAYDELPEWIRQRIPAKSDSARVLEFANGSSIAVGTSLRSGSFQKLLISEYGKTSVREPEKAREIKSGALNTVHIGQQIFIESTAEGQSGEFYDICQRAQHHVGELTPMDPKFFFFPWYKHPGYSLDAEVNVSLEMEKYFKSLGVELTPGQKAWYVKKSIEQGDMMKREFPSTPEESFQGSMEGSIFYNEMLALREDKRVTRVPYEPTKSVYTFWDLGDRDACAIWFFQHIGMEYRFIDYWEGSQVGGLPTWVRVIKDKPYLYGRHYWPHDGAYRQSGTGKLLKEMGEELGLRPITIVQKTSNKMASIEKVRPILRRAVFDSEKCALGLKRLDDYRREWDDNLGKWMDKPRHDDSSHTADALRTMADGYDGRRSEFIDYDDRNEYAVVDYDVLSH